jgi:hypothetical protein
MDGGARLVQDLVNCIPALRGLYEAHIFNMHGVLPHVFFAEFHEEFFAAYMGRSDELDWRSAIAFLEERAGLDDLEEVEVIVTSFLDYLPYPGQEGAEIVGELGPVMSQLLGGLRNRGHGSED